MRISDWSSDVCSSDLPQFLRIHRKALVNTNFIASLERDRHGEQHHWLKMKHATQTLPVSRRRLAEVRRFLTETCYADPRARIWDHARYAKSSGISALMKLSIAPPKTPLPMWQAEPVKARHETPHTIEKPSSTD